MHALRHSRRLGRLLALWLLLWFVAMAVTRVPPPVGADQAPSATAVASAHVDHEGHHHGTMADEREASHSDSAVGLHGAHASGSPSHCPLCTCGAAPPPPQFAPAQADEQPADCPAARTDSPLRVRTDAPPPARGPPLFS